MCLFYSKYSYMNLCSKIQSESQDMLICLFLYVFSFLYNNTCIEETNMLFVECLKTILVFPIVNVPIFYQCYWIILLLLPNVDNKLLKWNCYMCYVSRGSLHPIFIFRQDECWRKSAYRYALMHEGYDFIKLEGKF